MAKVYEGVLPTRYRTVRRLGEGDSSTVYRVHDGVRGQDVALKRLSEEKPSPDLAARFRREFAILHTLSHPSIARAFDFVESEHGWFFTSELAEGVPLDVRLARCGSADEALRLSARILVALLHLHRRGVCHGDLKSDNVICSETGVKLVDLGFSGDGSVRDDLQRVGKIFDRWVPTTLRGDPRLADFLGRLQDAILMPDADAALAWLKACGVEVADEPGLAPDVFVGRTQEIERLLRAPLAFLHGEEGAGKSAIVDRAKMEAQLQGRTAVIVRPSESTPGACFDRLLKDLGVVEGGRPLRDPRAVSRAIAELADERPLTLFLEDVHALGDDSFATAVHLARVLPLSAEGRVGIVLTWRDEEVAARGRDAELSRLSGDDVPVGPLDARAFAAAMLGGVPSAGLIRALSEATEGNASLLARVLADRSAFAERDGVWHAVRPLDVQVRSQFDSLGDATRDVVALLASNPGPLPRRVLLKCIPRKGLDRALGEATATGWLREARVGRSPSWTIGSSLRRRAVPNEARVRWHRPVLRALMPTDPGRPTLRQMELLVHHALAGGDRELAFQFSRRLAESLHRHKAFAREASVYERCAGLGSAEEAVGLLDRACDAWECAGDFRRMVEVARRRVTGSSAPGMALRLADVLLLAGENGEAFATFQALVKQTKDPSEQAEALIAMARIHGIRREVTEMDAALKSALSLKRVNWAPRLHAKALVSEAVMNLLRKNVKAGVPLLERAVAEARKDGDPRLVWRVLNAASYVRYFPPPWLLRGKRMLREAVRTASRAGMEHHAGSSRSQLAGMAELQGEMAESRREKLIALDLALESGHQVRISTAAINLAAVELDLGEGVSAMQHARLSGRIAAKSGDGGVLVRAPAVEAMACALTARWVEARAALETAHSQTQLTQDFFALNHILPRAEIFARWEMGAAIKPTCEQLVSKSLDDGLPIDASLPAFIAATVDGICRELLEKCLSAIRPWSNRIAEARLRAALAFTLAARGDREGAQLELKASERLAPRHYGIEALDIHRLLLRARIVHSPRIGAEFALQAYHQALARGRLRLVEQSAELIGDLSSRSGNRERAAHWYQEALRMFEEQRKNWFEDPEMKESLEGRRSRIERKAGEAAGAPRDQALVRRLLELDRELSSEPRLGVLLRKVMDTLVELTGAERGFLMFSRQGRLVPVIRRNMDRQDLKRAELRLSSTIAAQTFESGRIFTSPDVRQDERLRDAASVREGESRSVLCLPLMVGGKKLGVVYLDNRRESAVFEMADLSLLELFSERASQALQRAYLSQELRRTKEKYGRLHGRSRARGPKAPAKPARPAPGPRHPAFARLIGFSPALEQAIHVLELAAQTDAPVLITGETGTGKELAARGIHQAGWRSAKPFVAVNCAALSPAVLESELFGHVRGAFTGADRDREGLFQAADGGTLLLDEVAEMSPDLQAKLLRAIQEREVRKVGATASVKVDVRILAASNRHLDRMVQDGRFRADLYYRLKGFVVVLPPLRERRDDIPLLVREFLDRSAAKVGPRTLDPRGLEILMDHPWPGNVRELERVLEACASLTKDVITPEMLREQLQVTRSATDGSLNLKDNLEQAERAMVVRALEVSTTAVEAARHLGIGRSQLYRIAKRHRLKLP